MMSGKMLSKNSRLKSSIIKTTIQGFLDSFTVLHLITANGPDVRHVTVFFSKVFEKLVFSQVYIRIFYDRENRARLCFLIADHVFVLIIPQKLRKCLA
jgi:hypothetical protein